MRKIIKTTLIVSTLLAVILVGYYYSRNIEITKISLKCSEKFLLISGDPIENVYYKITRKIYDENVYKMYSSYPDTNNKDYLPSLIGISDAFPEVKHIKFNREHYPPTWYTFLQPQSDKSELIPRLSTATYVNRESLEIEDRFTGDGRVWSKGQCVIIPNDKFDENWKEQVRKIKEKLKF